MNLKRTIRERGEKALLYFYFLFLLIIFGTASRYFMYGQFDVTSILIALLLPVSAVVMYTIARILSKKEQAYLPDKDENWSIYVLQKVLHTPKPLFKGREKKGVYQRYYVKRWHKLIDSCIEGKTPWYLSFRLRIGDNVYNVEWERDRFLSNNENWVVYKNGEIFGKAATVFTMKHAVHLKEYIKGKFGEEEFTITSQTIKGVAKLQWNGRMAGSIKRNNLISGVHTITTNDDKETVILALMLFKMYYKP